MKQKISTLLLTLFFVFSFSILAFAKTPDSPIIYGKSGIVIDGGTGEIIYAKNIDQSPMYPASTTKILTALLLAENKKPSDLLTYTKNSSTQAEYCLKTLMKGKLKVGDTMTADDAMKSLLLFSANDIAYMIAENVGGSETEFANMMNAKIKKLGLKHTHFVTPNGLDDKTNDHYTSAYDLSVIAREAYKNPWVKKTMATKKDKIELSNGSIAYLENRNKLLGLKIDTNLASKMGIDLSEVPASNALSIGGKTGYTIKAGRCLVGIFEKNGRILIGVVMKSVYDAKDSYVFNDMGKIINWAYAMKKIPLYKANEELKTLTVKYKPLKFFGPEKEIKVPVALKKDATYYDNEANNKEMKTEFKIDDDKIRKLNKNTVVGHLILTQKEATQSYDLYPTISSKDLIKANALLYLGTTFGIILGIIILIILIKLISNRPRRRRKMF